MVEKNIIFKIIYYWSPRTEIRETSRCHIPIHEPNSTPFKGPTRQSFSDLKRSENELPHSSFYLNTTVLRLPIRVR